MQYSAENPSSTPQEKFTTAKDLLERMNGIYRLSSDDQKRDQLPAFFNSLSAFQSIKTLKGKVTDLKEVKDVLAEFGKDPIIHESILLKLHSLNRFDKEKREEVVKSAYLLGLSKDEIKAHTAKVGLSAKQKLLLTGGILGTALGGASVGVYGYYKGNEQRGQISSPTPYPQRENPLKPNPSLTPALPVKASPSPSPRPSLTPVPKPSSTPEPSLTPTSVPETKEPSSEKFLKATATAIALKGGRDSFVESEGFTREMFERMRKGTFVIEIRNKDRITSGTCWLAETDETGYYFVTNDHVLATIDQTSELYIWRPGIDQKEIHLNGFSHTKNNNRDLEVIKTSTDLPNITPDQALQWEDNYSFKKGQPILAVGFPGVFFNPNNYFDIATMGSVYKVNNPQLNKTTISAFGLGSRGVSGSPIAINSNGKPKMVGIIFGGSTEETLFKQFEAVFHNLNIRELINLLKPQR